MAGRSLTPHRPTITAPVPTDWVAGRNVTVADYIVEQIQAGVDPITAAQVAGVAPPEFLAWMRQGALVAARLDAGADWTTDFTPDDQDCLLFAQGVNRAHATHIARLAVTAETLARGGTERKVTRTKVVAGQVVEVVEAIERALPDPRMVQWMLEKLEPKVYGSKATLNVNVVDLTDTDSAEDVQLARMLEVARSLDNQAFIEATATDN